MRVLTQLLWFLDEKKASCRCDWKCTQQKNAKQQDFPTKNYKKRRSIVSSSCKMWDEWLPKIFLIQLSSHTAAIFLSFLCTFKAQWCERLTAWSSPINTKCCFIFQRSIDSLLKNFCVFVWQKWRKRRSRGRRRSKRLNAKGDGIFIIFLCKKNWEKKMVQISRNLWVTGADLKSDELKVKRRILFWSSQYLHKKGQNQN